MICPNCGCHDRVMRTRREGDKVIRIRRCPACAHIVETEEQPRQSAPDPPAPKLQEQPQTQSQPAQSSKKKKASPARKPDPPQGNGALAKALASAVE